MNENYSKFNLNALEVFQIIRKWKKKLQTKIKSINLDQYNKISIIILVFKNKILIFFLLFNILLNTKCLFFKQQIFNSKQ